MIAELLFWASLAAIVYTYFLYPAILALLVSIRTTTVIRRAAAGCPSVSIVISVFNEERVLPEKLQNLEHLQYPPENMEFLVGSDGSSDRTVEILAASRLPGLQVYPFAGRRGKVAVLNDLVARAHGDIIVFSDANTLYDAHTLRRMVEPFADPAVGGVCGELVLQSASGDRGGQEEASYWRYETVLKRWESAYHTILGATGGVYAIRRGLFKPLPTDKPVVDDFLIPLEVVRRGFRVVYEPEARAVEAASDSVRAEFKRRVRIGAQNISGIPEFSDLLHPRHGFVAFALWSHKILRWSVPLFALLLLGASAVLAIDPGMYRWFLGAGLALLGVALLGFGAERLHLRPGVLGMPYYVVAMNTALFVGFLRCVTGRQPTTWDVMREPWHTKKSG